MNGFGILEFHFLHSTTIDMHTNCTHVKITYRTTSELKMIIKNLKQTCPPALNQQQKNYDYERMPFKGYNRVLSSGVCQSFMFHKYLVVVLVVALVLIILRQLFCTAGNTWIAFFQATKNTVFCSEQYNIKQHKIKFFKNMQNILIKTKTKLKQQKM